MENFWVELFFRGLVLYLLTLLALRFFRCRAAAHRHLVCVVSLFVLLVLPLMQRFMPPLRLLPPPNAASHQETNVSYWDAKRFLGIHPKSVAPASQDVSQEPISGTKPSALISTGSETAAQGKAINNPAPLNKSAWNLEVVLFAIWGAGAVTLLLRLLVALFRLRRFETQSRKSMLGCVPILISDQVKTPLTWGVRRSVILLPAALLSGDPAACDCALRHEQAHIARWDWTWNLFAEIVCALCWFQPGAWWMRRRMRLESERACDDLVLLSGIAGPDYAAHLLTILQSICTGEVAPAMAQSGGMEERMRHILDGAKPRHAQATWMTVSASLAITLFSLATLRVSARPAEANFQIKRGAVNMTSSGPRTPRLISTDPKVKSGTMEPAAGPQVNGNPPASLNNASPAIQVENVIWGKVVDGLEPGLLLTKPDFPNSRRVAMNSQVAYQVLIRNKTERERVFEFQCSQYGPSKTDPYLIPNENLSGALSSPTLPQSYRAIGVNDEAEVSPAFTVRLAPGQAVVVPEEFKLFIGNADKESFPRIEAIKKGMNWIVQPLMIRRLTADEVVQFERSMGTPYSLKKVITLLERDGKTTQRSVPQFGAQLRGVPLFARLQIEVGVNRDWTLTGHSHSVNAIAFSPDSKRLVTGSAEGSAMVWNAITGQRILTLKDRTAAISSILYSPNGKFIFTGCSDGAIHVWDAASGEKLRTLAGRGSVVRALDVSADGAKVLGGYENGQVQIWNPTTGQSLVTFAYDTPLLSAAISPDGKSIAAGYSDATMKIWDLQTRQSLFSRKITQNAGITSIHIDVQSYLYTWHREEVKETKSKMSVMTIWGVKETDKSAYEIKGIIRFPQSERATSHVVAYDNFAMLFGLSNGQAVLNNMHDGPVTVDAHEGPVAAVAISPDGTLGATGGLRNGRGEARIWDLQAHTPAKQAKQDQP